MPTGTWKDYISAVEFTIGEGLNGEYYLWIKTISDNAGNKSTEAEYIVSNKFTFENINEDEEDDTENNVDDDKTEDEKDDIEDNVDDDKTENEKDDIEDNIDEDNAENETNDNSENTENNTDDNTQDNDANNENNSNDNSNNNSNASSDNTTKTNINLSSLSVDGTKLYNFNKNKLSYTLAAVENSKTSIEISAEVDDSKLKIVGTGTKDLEVGNNCFEVIVTAKDGTQIGYEINIERKAALAANQQEDDTNSEITNDNKNNAITNNDINNELDEQVEEQQANTGAYILFIVLAIMTMVIIAVVSFINSKDVSKK